MIGRSLRVRLTVWYVLLLALILAGFCTFIYLRLQRDLDSEADRLLLDEARGLATALQTDDPSNLAGLLDDVPAGTIVVVVDTSSGSVLASQSGSTQTAADLRAMALQPSTTDPTVQDVTLAGDNTWRLATLSVTDANNTHWIIRVARSDRDVQAALRQLLTQMAFGVPLALLVAVASGLFLAGRALDPIDAITRAAAQIGAEDLGRRLGLRGRDELARLAATFDGMLDRLEKAFEQQRQFTADASHELRTPLAMLMSQIDIALERPRTTEQYRHTLQSMRDDVAELSRLVSELLMLARAEAGQEPLASDALDLAELASGVASSMEPLASARHIQLVVRDCGGAPIVGDETRLMQLIVNLVDNAIKYTPPGGLVTVATRREPGWAIVEVSDTGPGIQPEHRQRIFERFFRSDVARSRGGGAGLGLAICRWIVEAHGGEIRVESGPRSGTSFCVRLPAAGSPATRVALSAGVSSTIAP
ncbi:MAG: heavy metal sensor histidine kinase [Chloroflexi bacterium]|nr:heavy metal sensor histidine kinase [Chloroflexota bacterium]